MQTLGERIKARRQELQISQRELAKRLGVTNGTVSMWENNVNYPKNYQILASELKTNIPWLTDGSGNKDDLTVTITNTGEISLPATGVRLSIPLLKWDQIQDWLSSGQSQEYPSIQTTANVSDSSYALIVHGDSMSSASDIRSIADGAIVIVDSGFEISALNRKIVIAQKQGEKDATIKEYLSDSGVVLLNPLNHRYPPIQMTDTYTILGIVKQIIVNL